MLFSKFLTCLAAVAVVGAIPLPQAAVDYVNKQANVVVVTQTVYANVDQTAQSAPVAAATTSVPVATVAADAQYKDAPAPAPTSSTDNQSPSDLMLQLVNSERAKYGKAPVQYHPDVIAAAQSQAQYEAATNNMTHDNSAGSLGTRLTKEGFVWSACAENVATGKEGDVAGVHQSWVNSPAHLDNMLGDYKYYGYSNQGTYWSEDYAKEM